MSIDLSQYGPSGNKGLFIVWGKTISTEWGTPVTTESLPQMHRQDDDGAAVMNQPEPDHEDTYVNDPAVPPPERNQR